MSPWGAVSHNSGPIGPTATPPKPAASHLPSRRWRRVGGATLEAALSPRWQPPAADTTGSITAIEIFGPITEMIAFGDFGLSLQDSSRFHLPVTRFSSSARTSFIRATRL